MQSNFENNYKGNAPLAIDVLDHGFVALRNISGPSRRIYSNLEDVVGSGDKPKILPFDASDRDPADSARMSFGQMGTRTEQQDLQLAEYLMKNRHTTPFEMVEVWVEMKMPIFVARQFVRHRTVSINEISGRYVTLPAEWYIPEVVGGKAASAKQGQADNLPVEVQHWFQAELNTHCAEAYTTYVRAIEAGVAPEHARMCLHLNHYTHWLWKQDLHNLMHFISLRDHSHAQIEAQLFAKAIDKLLRGYLPHTMGLYDKYRRQA